MATLPVIEKLLDYHVAQVSQLYWSQAAFFVNIISLLHISCWPQCTMQKRMPAVNKQFNICKLFGTPRKVVFNIKLRRLEISFMDWDRTFFF